MNELNIKSKAKAITIADLRKMGLHGNATAHLFDGTKVTLRKRFWKKKKKVLIARKNREKDNELHYIKRQ